MKTTNFVPQRVIEKYDRHCTHFNSGQVEELLADFFTVDAFWSGAGLPERRGHEQLREMFCEVVTAQTVSHSQGPSAFGENTGWDCRNWHVTPMDSNAQPWTFRALFFWTGAGEQWLCEAVMCYPLEA
ncbi:hypothetical protein [Pseudomonas juntendi]|uniref:SnoaL-like domain-containing protein n=1 Tax=Pseudomonas juntendi TaxID=2666183 RepID=A0A7W2JFT5_9PSED|nr:hypothetical protein [Pseudomonas juntendi]MBA6058168.1 hypothetical protein [Pseudomonas juntendi]MBA6126763.1 hypothetical protein [Pseudomonas juntendi]